MAKRFVHPCFRHRKRYCVVKREPLLRYVQVSSPVNRSEDRNNGLLCHKALNDVVSSLRGVHSVSTSNLSDV